MHRHPTQWPLPLTAAGVYVAAAAWMWRSSRGRLPLNSRQVLVQCCNNVYFLFTFAYLTLPNSANRCAEDVPRLLSLYKTLLDENRRLKIALQ